MWVSRSDLWFTVYLFMCVVVIRSVPRRMSVRAANLVWYCVCMCLLLYGRFCEVVRREERTAVGTPVLILPELFQ